MTDEVMWWCDECNITATSSSYAHVPVRWESTPDRQLCPECLEQERHQTQQETS